MGVWNNLRVVRSIFFVLNKLPPKIFCEAQARAWRKEGVGGRNSATPERSAERSEAVMSDFAFWICVSDLAK